ncbi:MAG: anthranilate synthase component II [Salibacteraceae bacterium]
MRILLVDNYDSFTYNLVHYIEQFASEVMLIRNDEPYESKLKRADKVVLSPGPGLPKDAGKLLEIIDKTIDIKPLLGVCLGHQAIGVHYGAQLKNLKQVHHGAQSQLNILDKQDLIYKGISPNSEIGHYHSWVIDKSTIPKNLLVTADSLNGEIMSVRHKKSPVWGVQFHPESILTKQGLQMIKNWVKA